MKIKAWKHPQLRLLEVDRLRKSEVISYDKALEDAARNLASRAQSFVDTPTLANSKALLLARKLFGLLA